MSSSTGKLGRLARWLRDNVGGNAAWDGIKYFVLLLLASGGALGTYFREAVGRHLMASWPRWVAYLFGFGSLLLALITVAIQKRLARRPRPELLAPPAELRTAQTAPRLIIVEVESSVGLGVEGLAASSTWAVTPQGRTYAPVRAELAIRMKTLRGTVSVDLRGMAIYGVIPDGQHGRAQMQFLAPDDIGRPGEHFAGTVTLTDVFDEAVKRDIDFGPIPARV